MDTPLPGAVTWAWRKRGLEAAVPVPVSVPVPPRPRHHAQVLPGDQGRPEVQDRGARTEALGAVPVRGRGDPPVTVGPAGGRTPFSGGPGRRRQRAGLSGREPAPSAELPVPTVPAAALVPVPPGTWGVPGRGCSGTPGWDGRRRSWGPVGDTRPKPPIPRGLTLTGQRCCRTGAAGSLAASPGALGQ